MSSWQDCRGRPRQLKRARVWCSAAQWDESGMKDETFSRSRQLQSLRGSQFSWCYTVSRYYNILYKFIYIIYIILQYYSNDWNLWSIAVSRCAPTQAILEESERRQDELVARRAHALQQRAEKVSVFWCLLYVFIMFSSCFHCFHIHFIELF